MNEICIGDVVQVQGKIERIIETAEGITYTVRFTSRLTGDVELPAYRVFPIMEGEIHE